MYQSPSFSVRWIPVLTIISVQYTVAVKHGEVNILHAVSIVITHRCPASDVLRDAVLARNPRFTGRVIKRYHNIEHTMRSDSHRGPMNMVESSLLRGMKF